jgi:hypothetical protein
MHCLSHTHSRLWSWSVRSPQQWADAKNHDMVGRIGSRGRTVTESGRVSGVCAFVVSFPNPSQYKSADRVWFFFFSRDRTAVDIYPPRNHLRSRAAQLPNPSPRPSTFERHHPFYNALVFPRALEEGFKFNGRPSWLYKAGFGQPTPVVLAEHYPYCPVL